MCGISGVAGWEGPDAEQAVRAMNATMARRGPNSEGVDCSPGVVFGHRRLSIFDLSDAGKQPMSTPDRAILVVFNGAIYNFRTLRRELEQAGHVFRTQTDTEVLLYGYRQWGMDAMVARLRGMFAIALWDKEEQTLHLVRDRLGVKPLVYTCLADGRIAFASTTRALRSAGLVAELNTEAVAEFLEFGFVTDRHSIYRNTCKVGAGCIVTWRDGRLTTRQYWTPATVDNSRPISFNEAVEQTEQRFLEAVRIRLDADVPVGTLLSAGIDSSLVCWAVAKLGADIQSFTVGTRGDPLDESAEAVRTARDLGIRHEVIDLSPEETPPVEDLIAAYAEPFAVASALGMIRVSRLVKQSATVLLTGDGGDDVFLGYPEHRHFYMAQRVARGLPPGSGALWRALRPLVPQQGLLRRATHFADYCTGGLGAITRAHPGWNVYERMGALGPRLTSSHIAQRQLPFTHSQNLLTDFLAYDRTTRFTGEYLPKIDGGTMYHALEGRAPFLDQELWNFAASLPYSLRLANGTLKSILRELARRHIGERVAGGPKRGFGIPVTRWLTNRWRTSFEGLFADSLAAREGWIQAPAVRAAFARAVPSGEVPLQLWYLYVLEHWLRDESTRQQGTPAPAAHSSGLPV